MKAKRPNSMNTRILMVQTQHTLSWINKEHQEKEDHNQIAEDKQKPDLKVASEKDTFRERNK